MPRVILARGNQVEETSIRAGASLQDIMLTQNPETGNWAMPTVCFYNGQPTLRDDWATTTLKGSDVVVFSALPMGGGGGSNPLQMILTLAVIAVAAWAGPALGGLIGGAFFGGTLGTALLTGGLMLAGSMLLGAIFKTPAMPSGLAGAVEQASPTYNLGGANNQARLYQPVPESFGRMRIVPDRVTSLWYFYIGNEQYVHQVFGLGRGEYDVEQMSFGDSIFWTKAGGIDTAYDVEVQFCLPGEPVTLFPDNVEASPEVSGQQVLPPNDPGHPGWTGPFSANPPGTTTTRILFNLVFPQGLGRYNDDGSLGKQSINYQIDVREIDDYGTPVGGWVTLRSATITMGTLTPQRITLNEAVPPGRYQARLRRLNNVNLDGRTLHTLTWEGLQTFVPGTRTYEQSVVALRIKATNLLSQQSASSFKVIYTRKLPIWNPATKQWSAPQPTRSFAAALSWVVRCDWGGGLPDSRIDLETLWAIDRALAAKGWTFDGYFDGAYTAWSLVRDICQPYGVVPRISGGALGFIEDKAGRPARHIFTPENIVRGSLGITYNTYTSESPDDVLITYLDEDAGYQQRDVQAALPDSESLTPATREFIGVVNRRQAFEMGVRLTAANRHRRIEFRWQSEAVGRLINMGDVAIIDHPFFAASQTGTIANWEQATLKLDLGKDIRPPASGDMYLALNAKDGQVWGPCRIESFNGHDVCLDPADYALILSQGASDPFAWLSNGQESFATVWSIQSGDARQQRVIITSVVPAGRFIFEITAINDHPEAYEYQDLTPPPWGYINGGGGNLDPQIGTPQDLTARLSKTSVFGCTITLSWLPVPGALNYLVQRSSDGQNWVTDSEPATNLAKVKVGLGYAGLRVAAMNYTSVGGWAYWEGHTHEMLENGGTLTLGEYVGAELPISWAFDPALLPRLTGIAINIYTGSRLLRTVSITYPSQPASQNLTYTPEMGRADGGPFRSLTVVLVPQLIQGAATQDEISVTDAPPTATGPPDYTKTNSSITFVDVPVHGEHTGALIIRGTSPIFQPHHAVDAQLADALPYTWSGLAANTDYYFRLAPKDAFFDVAGGVEDLIFTDVLTIKTEV